MPKHEEKQEINLRIEEEDDDDSDYDGYQKELKLKKDIKAKRQRDLKDIKFGNRQSKVIAFHKGSGEIHDTDRGKRVINNGEPGCSVEIAEDQR